MIDIQSLTLDECYQLNLELVDRINFLETQKQILMQNNFSRGDVVEFDHPESGTLRGIITRVNKRTVSVDGFSGEVKYKIPFELIRKSEP